MTLRDLAADAILLSEAAFAISVEQSLGVNSLPYRIRKMCLEIYPTLLAHSLMSVQPILSPAALVQSSAGLDLYTHPVVARPHRFRRMQTETETALAYYLDAIVVSRLVQHIRQTHPTPLSPPTPCPDPASWLALQLLNEDLLAELRLHSVAASDQWLLLGSEAARLVGGAPPDFAGTTRVDRFDSLIPPNEWAFGHRRAFKDSGFIWAPYILVSPMGTDEESIMTTYATFWLGGQGFRWGRFEPPVA